MLPQYTTYGLLRYTYARRGGGPVEQNVTAQAPAPRRGRRSPPAQRIDPDLINDFLDWFAVNGRAKGTIGIYRRCLTRLYDALPEGKSIQKGTVEQWRQSLLGDGVAPRTAEVCVSAANSLLDYCGRQELQAPAHRVKPDLQPELTRDEYHRLLIAARDAGQERAYFLVKTFGTLGLNVSELPLLTAEALQSSRLRLPDGKSVYLPDCFRQELRDYTARRRIDTGPVFCGQGGKPLNRSHIWKTVSDLARLAHVDEEKCNPRCLARLCQQTRDGIRQELELLGDRMYDRLLEEDQPAAPWL